jgi:hypothetical protein
MFCSHKVYRLRTMYASQNKQRLTDLWPRSMFTGWYKLNLEVQFGLIFVFNHSMAQEVSFRPITAETQLRSQASTWKFVIDKVALGQVFPQSASISLVSTIPPMLHVHLHLNVALASRKNGRHLGTCKAFHLVSQGPVRSVTTAWPDSLTKRCGYAQEHLMGAATATINTRNGNLHQVRVCHSQCIFKTRILPANHTRTFQGHIRLQQQWNVINFHFLFLPPVCQEPFLRTYIT